MTNAGPDWAAIVADMPDLPDPPLRAVPYTKDLRGVCHDTLGRAWHEAGRHPADVPNPEPPWERRSWSALWHVDAAGVVWWQTRVSQDETPADDDPWAADEVDVV